MKKALSRKSADNSSGNGPFINPKQPFFPPVVSQKAGTNTIQKSGIAQHHNVRKDLDFWSPILNSRRQFLNQLIQKKSKKSYQHDFRFLIPLAHRLMEQGGFDKGKTELNNPYYLRSKGNEGYTELTKTEQNGTETANFGSFKTDEDGVEAYIDQLNKNKNKDRKHTWRGAYNAIMEGGSFQDFIRGLQPDGNVAKGQNYSTKYTYYPVMSDTDPKKYKDPELARLGTMMTGMRYRLMNLIDDFVAINNHEINKLNQELYEAPNFYDSLDRIAYLEEDNKLLTQLKKALTDEKKHPQDIKWKTAKGTNVQQNDKSEETQD